MRTRMMERENENENEMETEEPSSSSSSSSSEIAFFDVETTVPWRSGQGYSLLEFGAVLVCPRTLVEVDSYSTLIRPSDLSSISTKSVQCNGITREAVSDAPSFQEVADRVFTILHGRVWAGHNIVRFDCPRIREAFMEIGRPSPQPKGTIDTLPLLTHSFGRRAGNMKMASLATYFGLGQQKHRSLDDVRMNIEVLKYCATVLFLESTLTDVFPVNKWVHENTITRSYVDRDASIEETGPNLNSPSDLRFSNQQKLSSTDSKAIFGVHDLAESSNLGSNADPSSELMPRVGQMNLGPLQTNAVLDGKSALNSPEIFYPGTTTTEGCSGYTGFLEPNEISMDCISAPLAWRRILLLHKGTPLQLCCMGLKVHFGISTKFLDLAGRPKLSFVVDVPASLCQIFGVCDHLAKRSSLDCGSTSDWRPVIKVDGFSNSSTVRLHIPIVANDDVASYSTEIYQKEPSGNTQKLVFSKLDAAELDSLFVPGAIIDAYFCLDTYDYQQNAGIRLVAKRLVICSK